ncbi:hypothetical protein [Aquimarina sp. AU58]|uniref:hypothetical protein n=1 Tax=Aquimarina sp. AU58 TaxID=1874112 RepID=UPI00135C0739|nr:hypothetical protein [Aquimarina sp. AU58]
MRLCHAQPSTTCWFKYLANKLKIEAKENTILDRFQNYMIDEKTNWDAFRILFESTPEINHTSDFLMDNIDELEFLQQYLAGTEIKTDQIITDIRNKGGYDIWKEKKDDIIKVFDINKTLPSIATEYKKLSPNMQELFEQDWSGKDFRKFLKKDPKKYFVYWENYRSKNPNGKIYSDESCWFTHMIDKLELHKKIKASLEKNKDYWMAYEILHTIAQTKKSKYYKLININLEKNLNIIFTHLKHFPYKSAQQIAENIKRRGWYHWSTVTYDIYGEAKSALLFLEDIQNLNFKLKNRIEKDIVNNQKLLSLFIKAENNDQRIIYANTWIKVPNILSSIRIYLLKLPLEYRDTFINDIDISSTLKSTLSKDYTYLDMDIWKFFYDANVSDEIRLNHNGEYDFIKKQLETKELEVIQAEINASGGFVNWKNKDGIVKIKGKSYRFKDINGEKMYIYRSEKTSPEIISYHLEANSEKTGLFEYIEFKYSEKTLTIMINSRFIKDIKRIGAHIYKDAIQHFKIHDIHEIKFLDIDQNQANDFGHNWINKDEYQQFENNGTYVWLKITGDIKFIPEALKTPYKSLTPDMQKLFKQDWSNMNFRKYIEKYPEDLGQWEDYKTRNPNREFCTGNNCWLKAMSSITTKNILKTLKEKKNAWMAFDVLCSNDLTTYNNYANLNLIINYLNNFPNKTYEALLEEIRKKTWKRWSTLNSYRGNIKQATRFLNNPIKGLDSYNKPILGSEIKNNKELTNLFLTAENDQQRIAYAILWQDLNDHTILRKNYVLQLAEKYQTTFFKDINSSKELAFTLAEEVIYMDIWKTLYDTGVPDQIRLNKDGEFYLIKKYLTENKIEKENYNQISEEIKKAGGWKEWEKTQNSEIITIDNLPNALKTEYEKLSPGMQKFFKIDYTKNTSIKELLDENPEFFSKWKNYRAKNPSAKFCAQNSSSCWIVDLAERIRTNESIKKIIIKEENSWMAYEIVYSFSLIPDSGVSPSRPTDLRKIFTYLNYFPNKSSEALLRQIRDKNWTLWDIETFTSDTFKFLDDMKVLSSAEKKNLKQRVAKNEELLSLFITATDNKKRIAYATMWDKLQNHKKLRKPDVLQLSEKYYSAFFTDLKTSKELINTLVEETIYLDIWKILYDSKVPDQIRLHKNGEFDLVKKYILKNKLDKNDYDQAISDIKNSGWDNWFREETKGK